MSAVAEQQLPSGRQRALRLEALGVAALVFAAYAIAHPDPVATLGRLYDDSVYLSIGKSIADGTGYRSIHLVGAPVHVKFPPLLPAIYAGAWTVFGSLDAVAAAALWLNVFVASTAAGLLWWLARRELEIGPVFAALCITPLLTARTMFYVSGAMGEPWLLLGWVASLVMVRRLERARSRGDDGVLIALMLGLTMAAAMLARTQALAIGAGIVLAMVYGRFGWRAVSTTFVALAVPLLGWTLWHAAMMQRGPLSPLPDQTSYLSWIPLDSVSAFARYVAQIVQMTSREYWSTAPVVLLGWSSPKTALLVAPLYVLAAIGIVLATKRFAAVAFSVAAMIVLLLVWPYAQDRFLTPVFPMIALSAAFALQRIVVRLPAAAGRVVALGVASTVMMMLALSAKTRRDALRDEATSPFVTTMARITEWVAENTSPADNIMAPWGGVIYLRTGRRTSIANPEEPAFAPSMLENPERFYATRLLADSVSLIVIWDAAPGRSAGPLRAMGAACEGLLTEAPEHGAGRDLHFYRVRRDLPCLEQYLREERIAAPARNRNAP